MDAKSERENNLTNGADARGTFSNVSIIDLQRDRPPTFPFTATDIHVSNYFALHVSLRPAGSYQYSPPSDEIAKID